MKFFKNFAVLLLVFGFLADRVKETKSDGIGKDFGIGSLPILSGMSSVNFKGPLAPIMVGPFLTLSLASTILKNESNFSKENFMQTHAKVIESLKAITNQLPEVSAELIDIKESNDFKEMRSDLDELHEAVINNFNSIINPNLSGPTTKAAMDAMLNYDSSFRLRLRSFITKYIKPKGIVDTTRDPNLFYDFILERQENATVSGDDCGFESEHTKLFKSFMYLLKTLTEAYAMAISAHVVQYQTELKANDDSALGTKTISLNLLNKYKADMKILMEKTKWALDTASRDIRNCGIFNSLIKGDTFDRVSFVHILPQFKESKLDPNFFYNIRGGPKFLCLIRKDVNYNSIEYGKCTDRGLKTPSTLHAFLNKKNLKWPYVYLKNDPTIGAVKTYGNSNTSLPGLTELKLSQTPACFSLYCDSYNKTAIAVSTQLMKSDEDSIITGVRFAIRDNIIYIDIREGTLLDDLTVDSESQTWVEAVPSKEVLYLNSNTRKFELGDVDVQGEDFLKTIQFQLKNKDEGIIGLSVNGEISSSNQYSTKSNEVNLSGSEGADKLGADVKNLVSKAPVQSKPYHVSLQPSDFEKDLGATTIPYFDTRGVETYPAAPLSGVGLYHQTVKGSGGFISLKVKNINLSRFVDYNSVKKIIDSAIKV